MKVFVAGGTGAIGKFLLPLLIQKGYKVIALVRTSVGDGGVSMMTKIRGGLKENFQRR